MKKVSRRTHLAALALTALAALAGPAAEAAGSILVADGGDVFSSADDGAVYRLRESGDIELVQGSPLRTPSGIAPTHGGGGTGEYFVSDIGVIFFGGDDGRVYLIDDAGGEPTLVYDGSPLADPFGMLRRGGALLVADFDRDAIFSLNLDPDGDGHDGPFPLSPADVTTVVAGPPFAGPNQMVKWQGDSILVADDSGFVYVVDLSAEVPAAVPFGPGFLDPVGLARATIPASSSLPGAGVVIADAAAQAVWAIDNHGEDTALLAGFTFADQILGMDVGDGGKIAVANAKTLFAPFPDGEVLLIDRGSSSVAWVGEPLRNPFSVLFVPGE